MHWHRPLIVVGRDQPTIAAGGQLKIVCSPADFAPRFGVSRQDIVDLTPSHPLRGLYRPHPIHQGGKFSAGWFDHPGQVGLCAQRQVGHRQAPGWRKLSATATSSRPGDVRPAKSANVQATASVARSPIFHTCRDGHNGAL
jgi:hypothetical protein